MCVGERVRIAGSIKAKDSNGYLRLKIAVQQNPGKDVVGGSTPSLVTMAHKGLANLSAGCQSALSPLHG
jgi:hypothetical protein